MHLPEKMQRTDRAGVQIRPTNSIRFRQSAHRRIILQCNRRIAQGEFAANRPSNAKYERRQLAEAIQKDWPNIALIIASGFAELESGTASQELAKSFTEAELAKALAHISRMDEASKKLSPGALGKLARPPAEENKV